MMALLVAVVGLAALVGAEPEGDAAVFYVDGRWLVPATLAAYGLLMAHSSRNV